MEFTTALFIFLAGALAHAALSRLMGVYSKVKLYRTATINCLGILKFSSNHAEQFMISVCPTEVEKEYVRGAIKYWQNLSLVSLKNSTPPGIWESMGIHDWETVERLIKKFEEMRGN